MHIVKIAIILVVFGLVLTSCPEPGNHGADGKDGINGNNGANGKDGADGKDGSFPALTGIEITKYPVQYLLGELPNVSRDLTVLQVANVYDDGTVTPTLNYTAAVSDDTFIAGRIVTLTVTSAQNTVIQSSVNIPVSATLVDTGLPVMYINTQDAQEITSKEDYVNGTIMIQHHDRTLYEEQTMRIRGRGHTTWILYPKKPYRIKLDSATDFFGMGSDRDWALLANYTDKTLLRTGTALHLSKAMNFSWTPDAQFVELVLNGQYLGNYQLVEHVKQDSARINVSKSTGYIIERDFFYLQEPKWFVTNNGYGYSFKHPDNEDITQEQFAYIENYMNEFESILASGEFSNVEKGYQKYIDINSFVRWFLFQNIILNLDTNLYITKYDNTANSKLHMGPVWDFEWSMGIGGWYSGTRPYPANGFVYNNWYYEKLLTDTAFVQALQALWNAHKTTLRQEVLNYIAAARREIYESQKVNFRRWNILNTTVSMGGIPLGSFDAEVDCDVQFFINRYEWLDSAINALYQPAETETFMILQN